MMRGSFLLSLFSASALAHPAGLWWGTDVCYTSPDNTDNQCSDVQRSGFDWSELANGDNWSFEGFHYAGLAPKNNCQGSGYQGNCIGGKLSREDDWKIKISAVDAPFSIRNFHLSTSRNTDVFIIYEMPDGSTCHHVASSSYRGTDVGNDQCGGATSVEFTLPEESKFGDCDLEIHQIDFDCSGGTKLPEIPVASSSQSHTELTPSLTASLPPSHPQPSGPLEIPSPTEYPNKPATSTVQTTAEIPVTTKYLKQSVTSTVWVTDKVTVTKCPPTVTDCPAHSTVVLTSTRSLETTVCPSETIMATSTIPSAPLITAPCPNVVPKCINTWLSIPKCDSNSDAACFCPSSEFTDKVSSCIRAWSSSKEEENSSLSYFAGICAPYVPKNPIIVEIVPTSTPLSHTSKHLIHSQVTEIPRRSSVPVSESFHTSGTPCTTITWSSHTATVPRVDFSTVTCSSTTSVGLVLVTPTKTPSQTSHALHVSSSKMTTRCQTYASSTISHTPKPTVIDPDTTRPGIPKPTESIVYANSGSNPTLRTSWAFGVALLCFLL